MAESWVSIASMTLMASAAGRRRIIAAAIAAPSTVSLGFSGNVDITES
jgi:hypothetical protein